MSTIIETPEGLAVKVEDDVEYMSSCNAVSDYISTLPLTSEQNNTLIAMLTENQRIGRRNAFIQGAKTYSNLVSVLTEQSNDPHLN